MKSIVFFGLIVLLDILFRWGYGQAGDKFYGSLVFNGLLVLTIRFIGGIGSYGDAVAWARTHKTTSYRLLFILLFWIYAAPTLIWKQGWSNLFGMMPVASFVGHMLTTGTLFYVAVVVFVVACHEAIEKRLRSGGND